MDRNEGEEARREVVRRIERKEREFLPVILLILYL
jgi:hypothetical protein